MGQQSSGYAPKFSYGAVQPAGPVDGDHWYCPVDAIGYGTVALNHAGRFLTFVYMSGQATQKAAPTNEADFTAASPNFPWVCVAGPEWVCANPGAAGTFTHGNAFNGSYTEIGGAGAQPLKFFPSFRGEFDAVGMLTGVVSIGNTATCIGLSRGTDGPSSSAQNGDVAANATPGTLHLSVGPVVVRSIHLDPGSGHDLRMRYTGSGTTVITVDTRWMRVRPIRLAHTGG